MWNGEMNWTASWYRLKHKFIASRIDNLPNCGLLIQYKTTIITIFFIFLKYLTPIINAC